MTDEEPRAHARRTDPNTSHAAADSMTADRIRASQEAVLTFLRRHGAMSDADLVSRYDGPEQSPSGLRTRRKELVTRGLVVDTGVQTLMPSGRWAKVWGPFNG